jgi:hypothetical protein
LFTALFTASPQAPRLQRNGNHRFGRPARDISGRHRIADPARRRRRDDAAGRLIKVFDFNTCALFGRHRWPAPIAIGLLTVAIVAAIATWVLLNGANPIHFSAPAA